MLRIDALTAVAPLASGAPLTMETQGLSDVVDWSKAQVNHYFDKSHEEYAAKRRRGIARVGNEDPLKFTKYTDEMFRAHDLNDEEDDSLAWAVPELRARLKVLGMGGL